MFIYGYMVYVGSGEGAYVVYVCLCRVHNMYQAPETVRLQGFSCRTNCTKVTTLGIRSLSPETLHVLESAA